MIVIRWAAAALFLIGCVVAADGVRDWLLAGLMLLAFLVFAWTFRGTRARPVSRHYQTTAGESPPQADTPRRS